MTPIKTPKNKSILMKTSHFLKKILFSFRSFITFRIRLLPIVIFSACLLLAVKVNNIWDVLKNNEPLFEVSELSAKTAPAAASQETSEAEKKKYDPLSGEHALDPFNMTVDEYQILRLLIERRKEVAKREQALPAKEESLKALEQKIKEKITELETAQTKLAIMLDKIDEEENANTNRLVKMAESMKPKDAAAVLEGVEFNTLIEIMERIKEAKAAKILSAMPPEKASYLMTELSKRNKVFKKDAPNKTAMTN